MGRRRRKQCAFCPQGISTSTQFYPIRQDENGNLKLGSSPLLIPEPRKEDCATVCHRHFKMNLRLRKAQLTCSESIKFHKVENNLKSLIEPLESRNISMKRKSELEDDASLLTSLVKVSKHCEYDENSESEKSPKIALDSILSIEPINSKHCTTNNTPTNLSKSPSQITSGIPNINTDSNTPSHNTSIPPNGGLIMPPSYYPQFVYRSYPINVDCTDSKMKCFQSPPCFPYFVPCLFPSYPVKIPSLTFSPYSLQSGQSPTRPVPLFLHEFQGSSGDWNASSQINRNSVLGENQTMSLSFKSILNQTDNIDSYRYFTIRSDNTNKESNPLTMETLQRIGPMESQKF